MSKRAALSPTSEEALATPLMAAGGGAPQEATGLSAAWRRVEAPLSAVSYILASLAVTSITKYAASVWRFPGSSLLLLVECVATVVLLALVAPKDRPYTPLRGDILRPLALTTLAKAFNMYLSFLAMKRTSLPVYNVLKRLQPVYTLLQDRVIRGTVATGGELAGVVAMCLGTVVTGWGDMDFDIVGYTVALIAAGCQSLYLVLTKHAQDRVKGLTHVDILFYTALYNCAIFGPLSVLEFPEVAGFLRKPGEVERLAWFLVPYVVLGALLNYTTFWCTAANSPLATSVAGNAKGLLSTLVGIVGFGAHLTVVGWVGLASMTAGGSIYSWAQARKKGSGRVSKSH